MVNNEVLLLQVVSSLAPFVFTNLWLNLIESQHAAGLAFLFSFALVNKFIKRQGHMCQSAVLKALSN